jgi:hypothetical protein
MICRFQFQILCLKTVSSSKAKTIDHFNDNSNDIVFNNYNTKIRLGFNTVNKFHRQLLLGFMNEAATDGIDLDTWISNRYPRKRCIF